MFRRSGIVHVPVEINTQAVSAWLIVATAAAAAEAGPAGANARTAAAKASAGTANREVCGDAALSFGAA